jgi:hypothetical protein
MAGAAVSNEGKGGEERRKKRKGKKTGKVDQ